MTKKLQPIVFFGTEDFSTPSLEALIADGFAVALVVTKPDSKKGRGQKLSAPRVKVIAERHNIPVVQPLKLKEIASAIQSLDSPVGVLVSYGKIIPASIIELFTPGIINVHPSLLPLYRGSSPMESAILNGDALTGITIMQLSAAMDAGPLYTQKTIPLTGTETKPALYSSFSQLGAALLIESLPRILSGELVPIAQNDEEATYCERLSKDDALVDPLLLTAEQIDRHVRAFQGFPTTKLKLGNNTTITITSGSVAQAPTASTLSCAQNTFFAVEELITPNGKRTSLASYRNGLRSSL